MKQFVPYAKFLKRAYQVKRDPERHLETLPAWSRCGRAPFGRVASVPHLRCRRPDGLRHLESTPFRGSRRSAAGADWRWLAAAVALVFVDRALMAMRWMVLLCALAPGSRPAFGAVLRVFFVSTFVGNFLPSVGGDVYRAYSLSRHERQRRRVGGLGADGPRARRALDRPRRPLWRWPSRRGWRRNGWVHARPRERCRRCVLIAAAGVFSERFAALGRGPPGGCRAAGRSSWRGRAHRRRAALRAPSRRAGARARHVDRRPDRPRRSGVVPRPGARHRGRLLIYFVCIPIVLLIMLLPITVNGLGTTQVAFDWFFVPQWRRRRRTCSRCRFSSSRSASIGTLPGGILYALGRRLTPDRDTQHRCGSARTSACR